MFKKNIINHVLIMAAGRGIRMMPLTKNIPKALAPLNESTLILEALKKYKKKIKYLHITVGYKGSLLAKHVIEFGVSSVINTEGKGNSWWIYNSLIKYLNEPVFVVTCDNVFNMQLNEYEDEYFKLNSPACMIIPSKPSKLLEGDYVSFNDTNTVIKISRKTRTQYYCSGIQVINPKKINSLTSKSNNFYDLWNKLIKINEIKCSSLLIKNWFAIDNLKQLKLANKNKLNIKF